MNNHFDIEDYRPYADKHRGKYVRSGPHWPLVLRYPVLFDEYEKLVKINAEEQYRLNVWIKELEKKIPQLNVDLAQASMNAYNSEWRAMRLEERVKYLEAELDRMTVQRDQYRDRG